MNRAGHVLREFACQLTIRAIEVLTGILGTRSRKAEHLRGFNRLREREEFRGDGLGPIEVGHKRMLSASTYDPERHGTNHVWLSAWAVLLRCLTLGS